MLILLLVLVVGLLWLLVRARRRAFHLEEVACNLAGLPLWEGTGYVAQLVRDLEEDLKASGVSPAVAKEILCAVKLKGEK